MSDYTAYLRGLSFRPIDAKLIVQGFEGGEVLDLERDPENEFDPNAIKVIWPATGEFLGFVAKEVAADLAPEMDAGTKFRCTVESNMMKSTILSITEVEAEA
jgi:hypothetical protein